MNAFLYVMFGGALGAGARYAVQLGTMRLFGVTFPWGTLAVNLAGGLLMGLLAGAITRQYLDESVRLFAGVGVLGGFTTFSAFGLESWRLFETGSPGAAFAYVAASVAGAIAMTGLGLWLVRP